MEWERERVKGGGGGGVKRTHNAHSTPAAAGDCGDSQSRFPGENSNIPVFTCQVVRKEKKVLCLSAIRDHTPAGRAVLVVENPFPGALRNTAELTLSIK